MSDQFIQTYETEEEVLRKIEELKKAGYSESDMYVMARTDEQLSLVRGYTDIDYHTSEGRWQDRFASFLTGDEKVHQAFLNMGINEHESEELYQNVQNGHLLLYVDRKYAERLEPGKNNEAFKIGEKEKTTIQHKKLSSEDDRRFKEDEEDMVRLDPHHYEK